LSATNKLKILNDPIYGFITIPNELFFDVIEHRYFQRLRRIAQLGLTYLVYPGAYHTRFHHALGAMHLMQQAVEILRRKGQQISDAEEEAVCLAILLHDIGHGPFSHALEHSIIPGISHEELSLDFMRALNQDFKGALDLAIAIFEDRYERRFLHQLISSQLDMDRLDYLRRDCFYTGVSEGKVNTERLISMLNVADDQIVIDAKGIYSIEKFIVARRLMYWQVYLHKTVLSAEYLITQILRRAREVYDENMPMPSVLRPFVSGNFSKNKSELIKQYAAIDDYDIMAGVKEWSQHSDSVLSLLCSGLLERRLLGVRSSSSPWPKEKISELRTAVQGQYGLSDTESAYLVFDKKISNNAYNPVQDKILMLYKNGETINIAEAADQLNISALAKPVVKYFLFAPKELL
jgi:hypothetical protein